MGLSQVDCHWKMSRGTSERKINLSTEERQSPKVQVKDSSKYTVTVIVMGQQMSGYKTKTPVIQVMAAFLSSLLGCNLCIAFVSSFRLVEYLA